MADDANEVGSERAADARGRARVAEGRRAAGMAHAAAMPAGARATRLPRGAVRRDALDVSDSGEASDRGRGRHGGDGTIQPHAPGAGADVLLALDLDRRYSAHDVWVLKAASPFSSPRLEVVRGRLVVTPAGSEEHETIVHRLTVALAAWCERHHPALAVRSSRAHVTWGGRRDTAVEPDVYVVPRLVLRRMRAVARTHGVRASWREVRHLSLAIEVASPSSRASDRGAKREAYLAFGTDAYWVVDPEARVVEVWTPGAPAPLVARDQVHWHPEGAGAPFTLALDALFAEP